MKKYESYKESGVNWIGKIPLNWSISKLKYKTENHDGKRIPISGELRADKKGDFPYYGATGIVDYINDFIFDGKYLLIGEDGAPFFDILRDVGFLAKGKFWVNNHAHILSANDNYNINYLCYLINCVDYKEYITGSTRDKLTKGQLSEIKILDLSFSEQTQIANYLDHKTQIIDALIEKKEQLIQKLQAQRQAIINEAVTKGLNPNVKMKNSGIEWLGEIPEHWEIVKFRFKFETTKGLTITKADLLDEGIPCVNYGEIHSKYGFEVNPEVNNLKCVSEDYIETNKGSLLTKGDFVFADTSEDIEGSGNFTHLNSDVPTFAGYHTIIARLIDNSNYRYFAYFFDSSTYRTQIQNLVKGVKVFSITNKILKDTVLLCPPVEEQQTISEYIDNKTVKIYSAIQQTKQSIQKLKKYRQSIITEAVTGKIDVRDWRKLNK